MIKTVLFDFGGVLTEGGKKGFVGKTIADLYGLDPADMDLSELHFLFRKGKTSGAEFFDTLNKRYGGHVTEEQFLERTHDLITPTAEVYELAQKLREHGVKTGILSNIFDMNAAVLRKDGLYTGFDPVVLSCEEGYAKPEEVFYKIAVERTGVAPEEILFIDDQEKCMPPARAMGMHTLIATSPAQIITDTKAIIRELNGIDL